MTQPKLVKIDLFGDISLLTRLQDALSHVTERDIKNLSPGISGGEGTYKTKKVLSYAMKAMLVVCDKKEATFKQLEANFENLTLAKQRKVPLNEIALAEVDYEIMAETFWLALRNDHCVLTHFHRGMGFDENFQIWVSEPKVLDTSDLPSFRSRSAIRW